MKKEMGTDEQHLVPYLKFQISAKIFEILEQIFEISKLNIEKFKINHLSFEISYLKLKPKIKIYNPSHNYLSKILDMRTYLSFFAAKLLFSPSLSFFA